MSDLQASIPTREHFARVVPNWSHLGAPLRPSPDDTAVVQRLVAGLGTSTVVAVLGLTPEIIGCTWPEDVRLIALDHSAGMIKQLWPPARGPANSAVVQAGWHALPVGSGTINLVAGDGCYMLETLPEGFDALTREVCRVLRPGGRFVIRVFLRPDQPELVEDIARAFARGEIGSMHALKLRLLAAVHGASGAGTRVDDAWHAWKTMPSLPSTYTEKRGWSANEVAGIERWQGVQTRYFMPTLAEFRQNLKPFLHEVECSFGRYELAERCPTFVFTNDK